MSYADTRDAWELFAGLPSSLDPGALPALAEALRGAGPALGLEGEPDGGALLEGEPDGGALVVGWLHEHDVLFAARAPAALVTPVVREALVALHRKVFAGRADLDPPDWDSAVRLFALLSLEARSVEHLVQIARDSRSAVPEPEVRALWGLWDATDVRAWETLRSAPSVLCAFALAV